VTRGVVLAHPATGDLPFRVGAALSSDAPLASLDVCERSTDLVARMSRTPDVWVLVVALYDERGVPIAGRLTSLHARYPRVPIILYATITNQDTASFLAAVRAGVSHVIVRDGASDVLALRSAIADSLPAGSLGRAVSAIDDLLTRDARTILTWCLDRAGRRLSVATVARGLGKDRSTINRHLRRCGLPSTEQLISWCRLLHVAWEVDRGVLTATRMAALLDFGVAAALRTFVRRHVGLPLGELKARGAIDTVLSMMRGRLTDSMQLEAAARAFDQNAMLAPTGD
jgi:hypothetical protein